MNKDRRQEIKQLKYKKRIQRFAASAGRYHNRKGEVIYNPKTIDVLADNGQLHYKTTSTPCSCPMCQDPDRNYHRAKVKETSGKELSEDLKEYEKVLKILND